jgi:hypothetical protein
VASTKKRIRELHGHTHTLGPCSEYPHPKQLTSRSQPLSHRSRPVNISTWCQLTRESETKCPVGPPKQQVWHIQDAAYFVQALVFIAFFLLYISTHEINTMIEYVWQHTRFSLSSPRRWLKGGNPEPSSPVSRRHPSLPRLGFHSVTWFVEEKMRGQKSDTG